MTRPLENWNIGPSRCVVSLAETIKERILSGEWCEGHPLPSQRMIWERSGMSRGTVREALRMLGVQFLVDIRKGRSGGVFVRRPSKQILDNCVTTLVRSERISLAQLIATRKIIETALAEQAVLYRTDEDLGLMHDALCRMEEAQGSQDAFIKAIIDWHCAVGKASGNILLGAFLKSISDILHTATSIEAASDLATQSRVIEIHRGIETAIRDRDPKAVKRRMLRHIALHAEAISGPIEAGVEVVAAHEMIKGN